MKKLLFVVLSFCLIAFTAQAQKYAIIDTRYILDKMPDYKEAQKQLDNVAAGWQTDIIAGKPSLTKCIRTLKLSR